MAKPTTSKFKLLGILQKRSKLLAVVVVAGTGLAVAGITNAATTTSVGSLSNPAGKCLTNKNSLTTNNNPVVISTCTDAVGQQWTFDSDGTVKVQGKCLDTNAQRRSNGTPTVVYDCNTNKTQKWVANSNKTIRNTESGRCLDSTGSMTVDGNTTIIATCDSTAKSQQWTLQTATPSPTPVPTPPPTPAPATSMLTRNGRDLMLNGAVYKSGSVNNFTLTGCHYGYVPTDAELNDFFSRLQPNTLVRTWAFEQQGEANISRVIEAAARNNQKLILALADGAEYCGSPDFDLAWYQTGYKSAYFSWISRIVAMHKDSPAIGMWEIMNEPALKDGGGVNLTILKSFFDQTSAHIKANDPNHLVSTGALAPWQSEYGGASGYATAHSSPNIDVVSLHEYDYAYQSSRTIISPHFATAKQAAEQVQKPMVIGEIGISLATGCMTATERAAAYKQKMDAYLAQGAAATMYWNIAYAPANEGTVCNEAHGNNDPINGAVMNLVGGYIEP